MAKKEKNTKTDFRKYGTQEVSFIEENFDVDNKSYDQKLKIVFDRQKGTGSVTIKIPTKFISLQSSESNDANFDTLCLMIKEGLADLGKQRMEFKKEEAGDDPDQMKMFEEEFGSFKVFS